MLVIINTFVKRNVPYVVIDINVTVIFPVPFNEACVSEPHVLWLWNGSRWTHRQAWGTYILALCWINIDYTRLPSLRLILSRHDRDLCLWHEFIFIYSEIDKHGISTAISCDTMQPYPAHRFCSNTQLLRLYNSK